MPSAQRHMYTGGHCQFFLMKQRVGRCSQVRAETEAAEGTEIQGYEIRPDFSLRGLKRGQTGPKSFCFSPVSHLCETANIPSFIFKSIFSILIFTYLFIVVKYR